MGAATALAALTIPVAAGQAHATQGAPSVKTVKFSGKVSCERYEDDSVPTRVRVTGTGIKAKSVNLDTSERVDSYGPVNITDFPDAGTKVTFTATCDPSDGDSHVYTKSLTLNPDANSSTTVNLQ
jgi:hypothetical protein